MKKLILLLTSISLLACSTVEESGEAASTFICETDSITYSGDVLPILEANCYECHNKEDYASDGDGNLLEGYEAIKEKIDEGLVVGNINHETGYINMPYRRNQIDSCSRLIITKWVEAGAPNN